MKLNWQDLPNPMSAFTTRNAEMVDLDKNKIQQYYSANTKIVVVQKCVTPTTTYYRTAPAAKEGLNWAFEASAFGLPNEIAPSAPAKPTPKISHSIPKQKPVQISEAPKDGEGPKKVPFFKRLFRRGNG